jgi:hypothetical protein
MKILSVIVLTLALLASPAYAKTTILLSENKAEEYQRPWYKTIWKAMHLTKRKTMKIYVESMPFDIEVGKIATTESREFEDRKREKHKKIWGIKFIVPFKGPKLWM